MWALGEIGRARTAASAARLARRAARASGRSRTSTWRPRRGRAWPARRRRSSRARPHCSYSSIARQQVGALGAPAEVLVAPEVEVVGLGIAGADRGEGHPLGRPQRHVQRRRHPLRDLRLQPEHLPQRRLVRRRPQVAVVPHPDQLRRHPQPPHPRAVPRPAHAPLQHVVRPQLRPDRPDRLGAGAVLVGAGPADHPEPGEPGQAAGDLLGQPVGEVLVARRAQVLERQHRHHPRAGGTRRLAIGAAGVGPRRRPRRGPAARPGRARRAASRRASRHGAGPATGAAPGVAAVTGDRAASTSAAENSSIVS